MHPGDSLKNIRQYRAFLPKWGKVLCALALTFSLVSLPAHSWSLAPPSDTKTAEKAAERMEHLRKAIATDPLMQNKVSESDLGLFVALGMVLGTDTLETAIRKNTRSMLAHVPEVVGRVGRERFTETLEFCAGAISRNAMSRAFIGDPDDTAKIVEFFAKDASRGQTVIDSIGGSGIAGALENKALSTHFTYLGLKPLFSPDVPIEGGVHALAREFDVSKENLSEVFAKDPWATADAITTLSACTPKDFQNLQSVFSHATYRTSFLNNPRQFARFAATVHLLGTDIFKEVFTGEISKRLKHEMENRFQRDANTFTVHETGLRFDQWGEMGASLATEKSNDSARYYRKATDPVCARDLWDEFSHALPPAQHRHFKMRPFEHIVHVRQDKTAPTKLFHMGLSLGRSEQEHLRAKGITMKDTEIGAAWFRMEDGKLIVEEIQSPTLHHQEEANTRKALTRYESWPHYLLLALEDYARAQGLREIVLPTAKYVLDHREKPVPGENLLPMLRRLYEEVPESLGYADSRKDLAQKPSAALQVYRQILQPDMFFENFVHAVEGTEPQWTSPMEDLHSVRDVIRDVIAQNISPSQLRQSVGGAWTQSNASPAPLIWNYTIKDKGGFVYHSLSLGDTDLVFTIDPTTQEIQTQVMGRYPSLAGVPPGQLAGTESAAGFEWQWKLFKWPTAAVVSALPTLLEMARSFADDRPHAQYLRSEYLRALASLLESIPLDSAALTTVVRAMNEEWPTLRDSEKIELLHVLARALPKLRALDRWALSDDDLKQIQNWVHWSAQMLRSNLVVSSKILRTLAPQSFVPSAFFDGAKAVFDNFAKTDVGRARQAVVFYTALWLTCTDGEHSALKPIGAELFSDWANAASKLFKIFEDEKASITLRDDFLTQLLLTRRCPSMDTKIIWPILKIALDGEQPSASDLLGMIERLELISKRFAPEADLEHLEQELRSIPRTWDAAKQLVNKWLQASQEELRKPYLKISDPNILTATPDLSLLLRFSAVLRASPPVTWDDTSWRMRVDFDNHLSQPMVSVSLMPSAKTKSDDPALDLLNLDFADKEKKGNEFIQAPRGTIGRIDMFVGVIGGKTTLFWSERQAAKAFSKLRKSSKQGKKYFRWLKELERRILEVARAMPEIEQVLSLSGEEIQDFSDDENLNKQVIQDNYGIQTFFPDLGFRRKTIEPYTHLEFSSIIAFMRGIFNGPFWAVDFPAQPQAKMNTHIKKALHVTGRFQVIDPGGMVAPPTQGIFVMGTLLGSEEIEKQKDLLSLAQAAKKRVAEDDSYRLLRDETAPFASYLQNARIVGIEGLPYEKDYDTTGDPNVLSVYLPWDILEYLLAKHRSADFRVRRDAEMELADALFRNVTNTLLMKKFTAQKREARNRAVLTIEKNRYLRKRLISEGLHEEFRAGRELLKRELSLRARVLRLKTFGERLDLVLIARGFKTPEKFAEAVGVTIREIFLWQNNDHLPPPDSLRKIEEVLEFPSDLLSLGKPLFQANREIEEEKQTEVLIRGLAREINWKKQLPEVMKLMMHYHDLTESDVASSVGITKETVKDWLSGKSYPGPRRTLLLAHALKIPRDAKDLLLFARSLEEELLADPIQGSRVKKARLAMGMTLRQLAAKIGIKHYQQLLHLESGEEDISIGKWILLANEARVPLSLLKHGKLPEKKNRKTDESIKEEKTMQYAA